MKQKHSQLDGMKNSPPQGSAEWCNQVLHPCAVTYVWTCTLHNKQPGIKNSLLTSHLMFRGRKKKTLPGSYYHLARCLAPKQRVPITGYKNDNAHRRPQRHSGRRSRGYKATLKCDAVAHERWHIHKRVHAPADAIHIDNPRRLAGFVRQRRVSGACVFMSKCGVGHMTNLQRAECMNVVRVTGHCRSLEEH